MKYEVFASQLEAHVRQSPVRGGRAIKTDRKVSNNFNQLLSRVKTIFGYKAHCEENQQNPRHSSLQSQTNVSVLHLPK